MPYRMAFSLSAGIIIVIYMKLAGGNIFFYYNTFSMKNKHCLKFYPKFFLCPVTIHGLEAAHSNDSGRYLEFCYAKIAPHS